MPFFSRSGRSAAGGDTLRLFFATDIHGSDLCFRKFLNAAKFYNASVLILGGDITGKSIVPIEQSAKGWRTRYGERDYKCETERELREVEQMIRDKGQYSYVAERDEITRLNDESYRETVFVRLAVESMERWMCLADDRLRGGGVQCYVTPGNDDFWEIDATIKASETVQFVEGRSVTLDDKHVMVTTGYSNITPWHSPRELEEPELEARLEAMGISVRDPANVLAGIHAPPHGTTLDLAPEIGPDLRPKVGLGGAHAVHVGSPAVRSWIERRQPLCALHGHVHESKGAEMLGQTLCINPGSQYYDGTLMGALVELGDKTVARHQLVSG